MTSKRGGSQGAPGLKSLEATISIIMAELKVVKTNETPYLKACLYQKAEITAKHRDVRPSNSSSPSQSKFPSAALTWNCFEARRLGDSEFISYRLAK